MGGSHATRFDIDVLACQRCGGRLRLIALVEDPAAIRAILAAHAEQMQIEPRRSSGIRREPRWCDQRVSQFLRARRRRGLFTEALG